MNNVNVRKIVSTILFIIFFGIAGWFFTTKMNLVNQFNKKAEFISLSQSEIRIKRNRNFQLSSTVYPENVNQGMVVYSSDNPSVAEVNKVTGYIMAKKNGKAIITAYLNNNKDIKSECAVIVSNNDIKIKKIKVNSSRINLQEGNSFNLTFELTPKDATLYDITYTSNDENIAKVDSKGTIEAISNGEVTITVTDRISGTSEKTIVKVYKKNQINANDDINNNSGSNNNNNSNNNNSKSNNNNNNNNSNNNNNNNNSNNNNNNNNSNSNSNSNNNNVITIVEPTSIDLQSKSIELNVGGSIQMSATIKPDNTNKNVTWQSLNENVATVSSKGYVTATGVGTTKIIATTVNGKSAYVDVIVKSNTNTIKVVGIEANDESIVLNVGEYKSIGYKINPSNATNQGVLITSSNDKVAKIDGKNVMAVSEGSTKITLKTSDGGYTDTINVKVNKVSGGSNSILPTGITIDTNVQNLGIGKTVTLNTTITPSDATNKIITWTSSDNSIATVSSTGVVKGIKSGSVVITASTVNGKKATKTINITSSTSVEESADDRANKLCNTIKNSNRATVGYKEFIDIYNDYDEYKNDDFFGMRKAHDCANKLNKPVLVENDTYNIYRHTSSDKQNHKYRIKINTSVDFNGSTINIHDEDVIDKNRKIAYGDYIYYIEDGVQKIGTGENDNLTLDVDLKKDATLKLRNGNSKLVDAMNALKKNKNLTGYYVHIYAPKASKIFIRYPKSNQEAEVQESFRMDINGKIMDDIYWKGKFQAGTKVQITLRPIEAEKIVIKNGNFVTIASKKSIWKESEYIKRGMLISRSNILLTDLSHKIVDKAGKDGKVIHKIGYEMRGMFAFEEIADATIRNTNIQSMRAAFKPTEPANSKMGAHSAYDLHYDKGVNLTIDNVKIPYAQMNMYDEVKTDDGTIESKSNLLWGVTSTSWVKNITYKNCQLNRIDTHRGVYNLTVQDTTLGYWDMTQIGYGNLKIHNVKVKHSNSFVSLRGDYGSMWDGKIIVSGNNSIAPLHKNETISLVSIGLTLRNADGTIPQTAYHNFGYPLKLPDVTIKEGATITVSNSNKPFYIYDKTRSELDGYAAVANKNSGHKTDYNPKINVKGTVKNDSGTTLQVVNYPS